MCSTPAYPQLYAIGAVHKVYHARGDGGVGGLCQSVTSNDEGMGESVTRGRVGVKNYSYLCDILY